MHVTYPPISVYLVLLTTTDTHMMMPVRNVLAVAVWMTVVLIEQKLADACSCIAQFKTVCEYSEEAAVVLQGRALSRSKQDNTNDDVAFTVDIIQLFKGVADFQQGDELTFVTGGNSAACGVNLVAGQEYLVGLYPGLGDGPLYAESCGLFRAWGDVTDEEREELTTCSTQDDTCSNGLSGIEGTNDNGSVCCPLGCNGCGGSDCAGGGGADLDHTDCCINGVLDNQLDCSVSGVAPCVITSDGISEEEEDLCDGRCSEYQECLFYSGDFAEDQYYCSAVCDPSPCEADEECILTPAACAAGSICGNDFTCSTSMAEGGGTLSLEEEDPCDGQCSEFQECLFYSGDVADDQYYCSASCELDPCEEGEECSLVPAGCAAGSICGNGYLCSATATVEDPCAFCGEFQECMTNDNDGVGESYCGDTCDPSPCEDDETCSLVDQSDCDEDAPACPPVSTCSAPVLSAAETDEEAQADDGSSALRIMVGSSTIAVTVVMTTLILAL